METSTLSLNWGKSCWRGAVAAATVVMWSVACRGCVRLRDKAVKRPQMNYEKLWRTNSVVNNILLIFKTKIVNIGHLLGGKCLYYLLLGIENWC